MTVTTAGASPGGRGGRRGRVVVATLGVVVLLALAARAALSLFAADLVVAAARRAALSAGVTFELDADPVVSWGGVSTGAFSLTDSGGGSLARAASMTVGVRPLAGAPWLRVSLAIAGLEVELPPPRTQKSEEVGGAKLPSTPAFLETVVLDGAKIGLGEGRTLAFSGRVDLGAPGSARLALEELAYSEPSLLRGAEGIRASVSVAPARAEEASTAGAFRLEVRVDRGAALAGALLVDLAANPFTVSATIRGNDDGGAAVDAASASLGTLVSIEGRTRLDPAWGPVSGDVSLRSEDFGRAFATLVVEPFGGVVPSLAGAEAAGRATARLRFDGPSLAKTEATVSFSLSKLETRSLRAEGLEVELPWAGSALPRDRRAEGRLRARSLALAGVALDGVDASLVASAGVVRATGAQRWKALGGAIDVDSLELRAEGDEGPVLAARLRLDAIDLGRAGEAAGLEGLTGRVDGDLGLVRLAADELRSGGAVDVGAFGGSVRVGRPFVLDPFGRVPSFGFDLDLRDIDLESLTTFLGTGRVSGVLEGKVRGLEIADGQPQAFEADVSTVRRRGVDQKIDVTAIAQLGALGGDSGSVTSRLLMAFDRYGYSKMGLRCRLHNDAFEIRGVESEGGRDYLVRGSLLPPSVSVVSHSQVVSFSEMLRRIERIAAIGEGGSPHAESP